MFAQIVLDNFTIGFIITGVLAIMGAFTKLIVYIFNSKTKQIYTAMDKLEKKIEPIPVLQQKLLVLDKIDFSNFPTKEDFRELKNQMHELSDKIKDISDESNSVVRDVPDKYQSRVQCRQNMAAIQKFMSDSRDEQRERRKEDLEQRKQDRLTFSALTVKVDQILMKGNN